MNRPESGPRSPLITDPAALASIIPFYLGYRPEPTTVTITTINGMRVAETRILPYTPRVDHDLLAKQLLQTERPSSPRPARTETSAETTPPTPTAPK